MDKGKLIFVYAPVLLMLALVICIGLEEETKPKPNLVDVLTTRQPIINWNGHEIEFKHSGNCEEEYITVNGKLITRSALIFLHRREEGYIFNCSEEDYNDHYPIFVRIWTIDYEHYLTICKKADFFRDSRS